VSLGRFRSKFAGVVLAEVFFSSIKTPRGVILTASQLGVEILRDAETNAIRQIWSLADGLLDIVEIDATHYEIRWYKNGDFSAKGESGFFVPAGTPIKIFAIGKPDSATGNNSLLLTEKRGSDFIFNYLWTFDAAKKSWVFSCGGIETSVRTWEKNADGNYVVTETKSDAGTNKSAREEVFTETISAENGARYVGRTAGGVSEFSSTRVTSGNGLGKTLRETARSGATTDYAYDSASRVISETRSRGFANLTEETLYSYAETTSDFADFRPRTIVQKIAGTVFKTENFSYDDNFESGATETHVVIANGETLTEETRFVPASGGTTVAAGRVKLEIRADSTATLHEYSLAEIPAVVDLSSNLGYTETATEGVFANGNFSIVEKKSTRVVRVFDTLGNEIRTEKWGHTGAVFEQISWENKTFSPTHKVIATERSDGKATSADFICTGPVFTLDENGVRTDFTYDEAKRLSGKTRHGVRGDVKTTFSHDASGRIVSETKTCGELSATTSRTFNADGSLASETDALGNKILYTYSNDGLIETKTFPDGATEITTRNAALDLVSLTGTASVSRFYEYALDAENALKITTFFYGKKDSARWEKTYTDGHGRVVKTERAGFGGNSILTTQNVYAGALLATVIETDFPQTDYAHDALGNVVSTTRTAGEEWRKENLNTFFETDADGVIWKISTQEILCSDETIPAQTSTEKVRLSGLSLDLESEVISTDIRGNATRKICSYNLNTKTRTETTAFPQCTDVRVSVKTDGVETSRTLPGQSAQTAEFDAFDRKISETDARGNTKSFGYDVASRLVSMTDETGATTRFEYDSRGRETKRIFADETFVASAYDLRGNKIAVFGTASYPWKNSFDEFGQKILQETFRTLTGTAEDLANLTGGDTTNFAYDEATGLLVSKTDALGNAVNYAYAQSGLLVSRTWARGVVATFSYDAWRQIVSTEFPDSDTATISHGYDALGREILATDAFGTKTFSYDAFGAISSETQAGLYSKTIEFHRDKFGRDEGFSIDGVRKNTIAYDTASGRVSSMKIGADSNAFSWEYLAGTALKTKLNYPNGAFSEWTYETKRDLLSCVKNTVGSDVISQFDYAHDSRGRRISATRTGTTMAHSSEKIFYDYNLHSELTSAMSDVEEDFLFAYEFDEIGNRKSSVECGSTEIYTANALNQYSKIANEDTRPSTEFLPVYDADGNAVRVKTSTGTWQIFYDGNNRPWLWENASTGEKIYMMFDSLGRRFEKRVLNASGKRTLRERYVYVGYTCVQILNGDGGNATTKEFLWEPSELVATRPLFMKTSKWNLFYFHDGNKNISDMCFYSTANGVPAHYDYAPYGAIYRTAKNTRIGNFDAISENPFRFSSEFYDAELDLIYYNFRHYSPAHGRFLSRAPLEELASLNLYAFAKNKPIFNTDYLGLKSWTLADVQLVSASIVKFKPTIIFVSGFSHILEKGESTWFIEGIAKCTCGNFVKRVNVRKELKKEKRTHIALIAVEVSSIPSTATTIARLVADLIAVGIMDELPKIYCPGPGSEKILRRFIKSMGTRPRITKKTWGTGLCGNTEEENE